MNKKSHSNTNPNEYINSINIQKILIEHRLEEGLTLLQMSNKIDISQQTLFNLEKGKTKARNRTIYKINKALGTEIPLLTNGNIVHL